jgi:stage II sporulation protein D
MAFVTERLGLPEPPPAIEITRRRRDGRAGKVRFSGAFPLELTGEELRIRLGVERLRSTLVFGIRIEKDWVVFTGGGSGHGVGLCQWGAEGMARAGASAADILAHYAPGAVLGRDY